MSTCFSREAYQAAVEELDRLCESEYNVGLVELLKNLDRDLTLERLRRLTGILLKQPFAEPTKMRAEETETGSNFHWYWKEDRLRDPAYQATPEYKLLSQLVAKRGQEHPPPGALEDLAERGVYKYLVLWLNDTLRGNKTEGLRDYLAHPESAEFESLLNIADWASQAIIGGVMGPMVGIPSVVVSLGLIGGKYGYRKLVEATETSDR